MPTPYDLTWALYFWSIMNFKLLVIVLCGFGIITLVGCVSKDKEKALASQAAAGKAPEVKQVVSPKKVVKAKEAASPKQAPVPVKKTKKPAPLETKVVKKDKLVKALDKTKVVPKKPANVPAKKTARAGSELIVLNPIYAFGDVHPGVKNSGEFSLKNNGTENITIKRAKGSCGCTVVNKYNNKVIKPGEVLPLKFIYNSKSTAGKVKKTIFVETVSPATPAKLTMSFTANIIEHVTLSTKLLKFVVGSDQETVTLEVKSKNDVPFSITGVTVHKQALTATFDKAVKASSHTIQFKGNLEALRKSSRGAIDISLDHPKQKKLVVNYVGELPYKAVPKSKYFRKLTAGTRESATIDVVSGNGTPFALGKVSSKEGLIENITQKKSKKGYKVSFDFVVPADQEKGMVVDYLLIEIADHPDDLLKVYCYTRLRAK